MSVRFLTVPLLVCAALNGADITVLMRPGADPVEALAATELARYLGKLYPGDRFRVAANAPGKQISIAVGTPRDTPELARFKDRLGKPESFVVSAAGSTGYIAGADPRGTLYGVYALLEKLGCGFYLSYDTLPAPRNAFGFAEWKLADEPLTGDRIVFNWHNFLSSASTWELEDWQHYISQAAKMRFNAIMVHAYGNNPMYRFEYNGIVKPVGYLATTRSGRDWGTQHVNDVRRMIGGEVFDGPVFGASIAQVSDDRRAEAAATLMKNVFAYARSHAMGITFALDVDTESANPQDIIATLPASARFRAGKFDLPDPDTPEGYAYFKAQIEQLLATYPEITRMAIWFRGERNSLWRGLTPEDFPALWRTEYERRLQTRPDLRRNIDSPSMFAIARIAAAYRKILDETGHSAVSLGAGSWRFDFLLAADAFLPPGVALIPLDYAYQFPSDPVQEAIRAVSRNRPVIPVVWAQHDDRSFAGRPYTPFPGFASQLRWSNSAGFGIIHWTTRPLDLYFKSLADQVWSASENELLGTTCEHMAERTFGGGARDAGTRYLLSWIQDAPMFGRETSNTFINQPLIEGPALDGSRKRLDLLAALRPLTRSLSVDYFEDWEHFTQDFYRAHAAFERAQAAAGSDNAEQARRELADTSAELAIRQYARTIAHGGASRGEKGILVSLNLRWLPYIVSLRQALALEPVRIKYGPTQHEPLAQGAGANTFYFDDGNRLWRTLGEKETGAQAVAWQAGEVRDELAQTAIRVDKPLSLSIGPMMGDKLVSGRYTLELIFVNPPAGGDSAVEVGGQTFDVTKGAGRGEIVRLRMALAVAGAANMRIRPVRGTAYLAGAVVTQEVR